MIKGLDTLYVKLDKLSKADTEAAMADACMMVERTAKELCPVDIGTLRDSITSEWNAEEGRVGTNLYYAPYVHQGTGIYAVNGDGRKDVPWRYQDAEGNWHSTVGQHPQPFLTDAFDQHKEEITEIFKKKLKEAAK